MQATGTEKIVMTLGEPLPKPQATIPTTPTKEELLAPKLIDENTISEEIPMPRLQDADFDLHLEPVNFIGEKEEEPTHYQPLKKLPAFLDYRTGGAIYHCLSPIKYLHIVLNFLFLLRPVAGVFFLRRKME